MTSSVIVVESLPPAFVAVMVYVADGEITVGVPEISPVAESKTRPVGNAGDTDQDSTAPPLALGIRGEIVVPFSKVNGPPL